MSAPQNPAAEAHAAAAHAAAADAAHGAGDDHSSGHHVASAALFSRVLITLLVLTFITVAASRFNFGGANLIIAMAIAAVKASLVIAFFMHLLWDTAMNKIVFLSSFLFLSLLLTFTLADLVTRGIEDPINRMKAPPLPLEWKHPVHPGEH
jgi:cytochrome c oxidase subunit 4